MRSIIQPLVIYCANIVLKLLGYADIPMLVLIRADNEDPGTNTMVLTNIKASSDQLTWLRALVRAMENRNA